MPHLNTRPTRAAILLAAALLATLSAAAQPTAQPTTQPAAQPTQPAVTPKPSGYVTVSRPSDMRELGFAVRGRVGEVAVKPGDAVKTGDLLMRLDAGVQSRAVEIARLEAEDPSRVMLAETAVKFRAEDLRITEDSASRGGAGENDLREARFQKESADIELARAQHQARLNTAVLAREQALLAEMSMLAPFDGVVLDVGKRPGETVEENSRAITLVDTDPLWLDVNVPTREAVKLAAGQHAEVVWEDLDNVPAMRGKVIFISPFGHGGARQIQVRVEVPNPKGLPSGLHGNVRFLTTAEPPAGESAARDGTPSRTP